MIGLLAIMAFARVAQGGLWERVAGIVTGRPVRFDVSSPTVVEKIQQLSKLETVENSLDKIVEGERQSAYLPNFLAGDMFLLVAHGEVIAGIDPTTRFNIPAGTHRSRAASPPFLPKLQVMYPPNTLPAIALEASTQGFPPWETSNKRSRSVEPGTANGTIEASMTETRNSPGMPSLMAQPGRSGRWAVGAN